MVGLGQKGVARVGGDYLKYLKRDGTEKKGRKTKILKRGDKLDHGGWGEAGTPLRTMRYIFFCKFSFQFCYHKK